MVGHGGDILECGTGEAFEVDADMVSEVSVFTGEESFDEVGRQLGVFDESAGLRAKGCQLGAIGCEDEVGLGDLSYFIQVILTGKIVVVKGDDEEEDGTYDADPETDPKKSLEPAGGPVWEFESFFAVVSRLIHRAGLFYNDGAWWGIS